MMVVVGFFCLLGSFGGFRARYVDWPGTHKRSSYFFLLSDRIKGVLHLARHLAFSWFIKKQNVDWNR